MQEIERKFLIKNTEFLEDMNGFKIVQGYLSNDPKRNVRVRIKGDLAFITIKGMSNESGLSRFEWEKEIDVKEAEELLKLCLPGVIEKTRYEIASGDHTFEVDIFEGENKGLIIAEVELKSEDEAFEKPEWLGDEVTGDVRYYNSYLSTQPFAAWSI
ncbi:CYTH domain-containing protein [Nonlabens sp. Hel1_33_55]|uniref:CYTH domain-containing protein n=1 Tax=Nonlabens sp. Hel1_33_55 TaxID=1336802 RepID=UPI000875E509|nr:CYTH domain-containing protein [Nonlabens sp. Hel1_33_55]SCY29081.1 CYTH domain-containing protein [Nonlabens sp. Hel1_33_55]